MVQAQLWAIAIAMSITRGGTGGPNRFPIWHYKFSLDFNGVLVMSFPGQSGRHRPCLPGTWLEARPVNSGGQLSSLKFPGHGWRHARSTAVVNCHLWNPIFNHWWYRLKITTEYSKQGSWCYIHTLQASSGQNSIACRYMSLDISFNLCPLVWSRLLCPWAIDVLLSLNWGTPEMNNCNTL